MNKRDFLKLSILGGSVAGGLPLSRASFATETAINIGNNTIHVISDGVMHLPVSMIMPDGMIDPSERDSFLSSHQLSSEQMTQDCNITVVQQDDKTIVFDVGGGPNFMPTTGKLFEELSNRGIDAEDVTDVVFTHAHPDHLWGLLDDFDELLFANAQYHINQREWEYWLNDNTLSNTPENRQAFVVGAQNRLPLIEEQLSLFNYADEILPGIEAVDTSGHTPGHTAFAIHGDSESIMLLGDALTNPFIAFEKPAWRMGMDQDPDLAVKTRLKLLDRLASDQQKIIGFHLPFPGMGFVERYGKVYRYSA